MRGYVPYGLMRVTEFTLVFPACAGMFLLSAIDRELQSCFPRVRGDVPKPEADAPAVVVFSPRTRGCSGVVVAAGPASGIFPACAGMFRL